MSLQGTVDLVIWPECIFGSVDARSRSDLTAALPMLPSATPLILGASFNEPGYENTAVLLRPDHLPTLRTKQHAVPFAEQTPSWLYPLARKLSSFVAPPYQAADTGSAMFALTLHGRTYQLLTVICYESMFLSYESIAQDTDLIIILSENVWFQSHTAEKQQLAFAQLIAHRHHRPVILASNNGITAWIDAHGIIQDRLPSHTADVLVIEGSSVP